jgi:OOP family OmpA-OmpF porin
VTVHAPADVLFDENSAALTDAANPVLDRLAADISQRAIGPVTVGGGTDHYGTHTTNMALGRARATTVVEALAARGINPARMTPTPLGDTAPLCREIRPDGTDDADCRARDRRVTLTYNVAATPSGTGTR